MKWWREFLNCLLPATYYPHREAIVPDGPRITLQPVASSLRRMRSTHLYDHVYQLQQWLNRFTTALSSPMASRAAAAVSREPILILQHFDGVDRWPPPTVRPSAITACFRTNSSLSFKALISPGKAALAEMTKASVASSMNSSFRVVASVDLGLAHRGFPSAMIADFRTSQSRRSLSNTSTAGDQSALYPQSQPVPASHHHEEQRRAVSRNVHRP